MAYYINNESADGEEPRLLEHDHHQSTVVEVFVTTPGGARFQFRDKDTGGSLVDLMTQKKLADHAGAFTLNFAFSDRYFEDDYFVENEDKEFVNEKNKKDKVSYRKLFPRYSFVKIKINGVVQMVGRIDMASIADSPKGTITMVVTGRDLGAVLLDYKRWWTFATNSPFDNLSALASADKINFSEIPQKLLVQIYEDWFDKIYTKTTWKSVPNGTDSAGKVKYKRVVDTSSVSSNYGWHIIDSNGIIRTLKDVLKIRYRDSYEDNTASAMALAGGCYADAAYRAWEQMSNNGDFFSLFDIFASKPLNEIFITSGGRQITLGKKFPYNKTGKLKDIIIDPNGDPPTVDFDRVKLDEDSAYLVFRPAPYYNRKNIIRDNDNDDIKNAAPRLLELEDIETLVINDSMIRTKTLQNYAPEKIYSTYFARPSGLMAPEGIEAAFPPIWDEDKLRYNGYNPLIVDVSFLDIKNKEVGKKDKTETEGRIGDDIFSRLQKMLMHWFQDNDKNLGGSVTIVGQERAREGIAIDYRKDLRGEISDEEEMRLFYCTGVTQNWRHGGEFTTTLELEHGVGAYDIPYKNRPLSGYSDPTPVKKNEQGELTGLA